MSADPTDGEDPGSWRSHQPPKTQPQARTAAKSTKPSRPWANRPTLPAQASQGTKLTSGSVFTVVAASGSELKQPSQTSNENDISRRQQKFLAKNCHTNQQHHQQQQQQQEQALERQKRRDPKPRKASELANLSQRSKTPPHNAPTPSRGSPTLPTDAFTRVKTSAGLLFTLVTKDDVLLLLGLERRTEHGLFLQFPGGKFDRTDPSAYYTAWRETNEESILDEPGNDQNGTSKKDFFSVMNLTPENQHDSVKYIVPIQRNYRSKYSLYIIEHEIDALLPEIKQPDSSSTSPISTTTPQPSSKPDSNANLSPFLDFQNDTSFYNYYAQPGPIEPVGVFTAPLMGENSKPQHHKTPFLFSQRDPSTPIPPHPQYVPSSREYAIACFPFPQYPISYTVSQAQFTRLQRSFLNLPLFYDFFCHQGRVAHPHPAPGICSTRMPGYLMEVIPEWHLFYPPAIKASAPSTSAPLAKSSIQQSQPDTSPNKSSVQSTPEQQPQHNPDQIQTTNSTTTATTTEYYSSNKPRADRMAGMYWVSLRELRKRFIQKSPDQFEQDIARINESAESTCENFELTHIQFPPKDGEKLFRKQHQIAPNAHLEHWPYPYSYLPHKNQLVWDRYHKQLHYPGAVVGNSTHSEFTWIYQESILAGYHILPSETANLAKDDDHELAPNLPQVGQLFIVDTLSGFQFPLSNLVTRCLTSSWGILSLYQSQLDHFDKVAAESGK